MKHLIKFNEAISRTSKSGIKKYCIIDSDAVLVYERRNIIIVRLDSNIAVANIIGKHEDLSRKNMYDNLVKPGFNLYALFDYDIIENGLVEVEIFVTTYANSEIYAYRHNRDFFYHYIAANIVNILLRKNRINLKDLEYRDPKPSLYKLFEIDESESEMFDFYDITDGKELILYKLNSFLLDSGRNEVTIKEMRTLKSYYNVVE